LASPNAIVCSSSFGPTPSDALYRLDIAPKTNEDKTNKADGWLLTTAHRCATVPSIGALNFCDRYLFKASNTGVCVCARARVCSGVSRFFFFPPEVVW